MHHGLHSLHDLPIVSRDAVRPTAMCRLVFTYPQLYCTLRRFD